MDISDTNREPADDAEVARWLSRFLGLADPDGAAFPLGQRACALVADADPLERPNWELAPNGATLAHRDGDGRIVGEVDEDAED